MIRIQRILVPTDFSEFSLHAIRYGCEFAKRFDAELHLATVVEDLYPLTPDPGLMVPTGGEYLSGMRESAERELAKLPAEDLAEGLHVERQALVGTPFLEIVRYARDQKIDMIVIGTHGRTGLIHVLMGSVAEKVVRKAPCPVLTIRPEGHGFVIP